jgi:hypothetical protein
MILVLGGALAALALLNLDHPVLNPVEHMASYFVHGRAGAPCAAADRGDRVRCGTRRPGSCWPECRVTILTTFETDGHVFAALRAGT